MFEILPVEVPQITQVLWVMVVAIGLYHVIDWYRRYKQWVAVYDRLPGKRDSHWFWGHMKDYPGPNEAGLKFGLEQIKKHPQKLRRVWIGPFRCVVLLQHPDAVKELLTKSANLAPKPRGPGTPYEVGIRWLGEGLLIANGGKWARNRKLLTPAFHYDILQPYLGIANRCTDVFLDKLENFAESQTPFEVFQHISLCSLDIITNCAFSYNADCQKQGDRHPYVQAVTKLQMLWVKRSLNLFHFMDWFYFNFTSDGKEFLKHCDFVHEVAEEIIRKRRVILAKEGLPTNTDNKKRKLDFLDIILTAKDDEGNSLTDLEIRNEVDTFLFEGHDTTTSATSFILTSLAQHPDIQERCRQEVDSLLEGRDSDDLEWQDLNKLEYLTQCIKEGLRMYSPVFWVQRQVTVDTELAGYHIPAWTNIGINVYNIHHRDTIWGDDHLEFKPERFSSENVAKMHPFQFIPFSAGQSCFPNGQHSCVDRYCTIWDDDHLEFKPERFAPENVAKMHPFQFIPFSAGERNCIGQNFAMNEIKVIVARTIHRFKLSLKPGHEVKKRMGIIMRTEDGVLLQAEKI